MSQNYPRALTSEDIFKRLNSKEVKDALSVINTYNNGLTNTYGIIKKYITYMRNYDSATQYYLSGTPSLETKPASEWEVTDYSNHLNDLYYDTENGIVFIFKYNENDNEYYWEEVNDDTLPSVMATAYEQADVTQDNMRNMYYAEPTVPYSVGDIWLSGDNIYRCIRNETEDSQFYMEDWVNYQQYNDSIATSNALRVLSSFKETVETEYVTKTLLETTTDTINAEVSRVETVADSKSRVFTSEPIPPYYVGDSYIKEVIDSTTGITMNLIYVCQHSRETGSYHAEDFSLQPGYATQSQLKLTDDKAVLAVGEIGNRGSSQTTIAEDINSINATLRKIEITSDEKSADGIVNIENLAESSIIYLRVYPCGDYDIKSRYSAQHSVIGKYHINIPVIVFYNGEKTYQYELPKLYFYDDVYDEFILDNVLEKAYVIHRIGFNEQNQKYILAEEVIEYLNIDIKSWSTPKGNNTIFIPGYTGAEDKYAHIQIKALLNTGLANSFATEIYVDRNIEISEQGIMSNVSNTYATKSALASTETTLNSNITQAVDDSEATINASVTRKLRDVADEDGNVTGASLVLAVNEDGSSGTFSADKLKLEGYTTINNGFGVDLNGNMFCQNANINGDLVSSKGLYTNLQYNGNFYGWYQEGYTTNYTSWFFGYNIYDDYNSGAHDIVPSVLIANVFIPTGFIVDKAYITIKHTPVDWKPYAGGTSIRGCAKKVKAYKFSGLDNTINAAYNSQYQTSSTLNATLISGNPMGSNGKTFSENSSETYTSGNIASAFNGSGQYYIGIKTSENDPSPSGHYGDDETAVIGPLTGYASMVVNIYGWMQLR